MTDKDATCHDTSDETEDFAQLDQDSLMKLADLARDNPKAASVMLVLLANVGDECALVVSQATLAKLCKCSIPTVKRAIAVLVAEHWIVAGIIGSGRVASLAYFINSRVDWTDKRENLEYVHFNARVLISGEDNPNLKSNRLSQSMHLESGETVIPECTTAQ
ncbi:hypothetical protein PMI35_03733 [Pseudomonas sp. GM78]|uniref:helix-turn-helix domain-containing protein n=1 Tax=Pseudomonas sp. GM78 TaxID=1144337 RepID=UPI000270B999|nr:helix-turn-helix domain-containing protein [Pseudomonas sp. GM78]EJN26738.1 hypothetical protein PMI35_03733 [Pseudomonas sp. GM78]